MRALLERYFPLWTHQFVFAFLYHVKLKLKHFPTLHRLYIERLAYYPRTLLYFRKRENEQFIFPHQPQSYYTATQETQRLYHTLKYPSRNHAHRH
jgi:hypothetical protein